MALFYENCPVTQERAVDFLLGELSYEETAALDNHLRECETCNALVESYVNLFKNVRSIKAPPVSPETYVNLKQRVFGSGQKKTGKQKKEAYFQMFSLFLSVAAVILLITMFSENVFISELPKAELSMNESWFIDTMMIAAIQVQAPLHDSLIFMNNFLASTKQRIISTPNFITQFYSFTSDILAQYAARNTTIAPESLDLILLFQMREKDISNTPESGAQCMRISFRKSERTV